MLANTLESYPRDDLFQIDVGLLASFCEQINELADRPRIRVLPRIDHFDRFVSVIVYVPREQYDSDVREKIGNYLKTVYDGRVSAYYPAFPEGGLARVHFIIGRYGGKTPRVAAGKARRCGARHRHPLDRPLRTAGRATRASKSPSARPIQAAFTPAEAYADLADIAACLPATRSASRSITASAAEAAGSLELKIFHAGEPVSLSHRVPLLENLGFRVISEQTHRYRGYRRGRRQRSSCCTTWNSSHRDGRVLDLDKYGAALEEAFLPPGTALIEDDSFNRLILLGGPDRARE